MADEFYSEEFLQSRLERQIREQCELHGWSVARTDPLEILMAEEDEEDEYEPINATKGT